MGRRGWPNFARDGSSAPVRGGSGIGHQLPSRPLIQFRSTPPTRSFSFLLLHVSAIHRRRAAESMRIRRAPPSSRYMELGGLLVVPAVLAVVALVVLGLAVLGLPPWPSWSSGLPWPSWSSGLPWSSRLPSVVVVTGPPGFRRDGRGRPPALWPPWPPPVLPPVAPPVVPPVAPPEGVARDEAARCATRAPPDVRTPPRRPPRAPPVPPPVGRRR